MAKLSLMGRELSLSPRDWVHSWGLAFANTGRGLAETFSNKRLWIGLAVSIVLHALIFLLSMDVLRGKKVSEDVGNLLDVAYDESLPPKAAKLVQQETPFGNVSGEERAPIDLTKGKVTFQAKVSMEQFSLESGQASLSGDVIRINPNASISTEEILAQAPIDISRSLGGVGSQNPFARVAGMGGSPIELDTRATEIGTEASKPKFTTGAGQEVKGAQEVAAGAQKSGFSLSGDLSREDIVKQVPPPYPTWARQRGLTNVIISIQFQADATGNVLPTMVVTKSTGYPNWDATVRSALAGWKFKPASGVARRVATITFRFILT